MGPVANGSPKRSVAILTRFLSSPTVGYLRRTLTAVSAVAFKLTFGALVIVAALSATYVDSGGNFSRFELRVILELGMAFSGVLMLGALVILRSKTAVNAAMALVTLGSVFTAYIVHTELYFPENRAALIVICGAALFGLFVAFRLIDDLRWGGVALSGLALIGVVAVWPELIMQVWPDLIAGMRTPGGVLAVGEPMFWLALIGICGGGLFALFVLSRIIDVSRWGGVALLAAASFVGVGIDYPELKAGGGDGWEKHTDIRAIKFEETPNVYFIGFDAMVPESILEKYMGIETTEFHGVFAKEARRFRNLFANSVPTTLSFNTLMALDVEILLGYHRQAGGAGPSYFSGHDLSPLVWIMRENDYETTAIFNDAFFGHRQGQYIDNYIINRKEWGICARLDEDIRLWAFWGYCRILGAESWQQGDVVPRGDFLLRELTNIDESKPQFVIAYLFMPGHTPKIFSYEDRDNREKFIERFTVRSNEAAIYLRQIIEHVRSNDPSAILFVFGDHGAWLSRGIELDENPTFFLQDRFAILGGVYPRDRCGAYFDEAENKGYMTILDAVHAILSCLSRGQSALVEPRHDRFLGSGIPSGREYHYREYLYE